MQNTATSGKLALSGASLLAVTIAACGPATEMPAADAGAPAHEITAEASAPAPCAGASLKLTGLCTDAGDALYLKVNANHALSAPHCVWRPQEVETADGEALVFRSQDCAQGDQQPVTYSFADDTLTATYPPFEAGEPPYDVVAMQIFALNGETAEAAALKTLDSAPEDQKDRCEVQAMPGASAVGQVFLLAPTETLRTELEASAEEGMYDACGLYGATDSATYWEARDGRALFHSTGQDDPAWDPASFTFYVRGMNGIWTQSGG